jgi:hypothetical protein
MTGRQTNVPGALYVGLIVAAYLIGGPELAAPSGAPEDRPPWCVEGHDPD